MSLRSIGIRVVFTGLVWSAFGTVAHSQSVNGKTSATATSQTAAQVTPASAELVKGKLSPTHSKPGDAVAMRLNEDVKSNGQVILKKGTIINGVVQNARQVDQKSSASGKAGSMMEIQWLAPEGTSAAASSQVMFALRSLTQVNPNYQDSSDLLPIPNLGNSQAAGRSSGGGLLGGGASAAGGVLSSVGGTAAGAGGNASGAASGAWDAGRAGVGGNAAGTIGAATSGAAPLGSVGSIRSSASAATGESANAGNPAATSLIAAPGVTAADSRTSTMLQHDFGFTGNQQFFNTGSGELVSATGYRENLSLFSRMSNDTVLTSSSKDFEVRSGAQVQLLVAVGGK